MGMLDDPVPMNRGCRAVKKMMLWMTSAPLPMAPELATLMSHPKKREWRVGDGEG
jgi:hypothetical protein